MDLIEARILLETRENIKRLTNDINNKVVLAETLADNLKKIDIIKDAYDLSSRKRDCIDCAQELAGLLVDFKQNYERLYNDIANTIPQDLENAVKAKYIPLSMESPREKRVAREPPNNGNLPTSEEIDPQPEPEPKPEPEPEPEPTVVEDDSRPFDEWFHGLNDAEMNSVTGAKEGGLPAMQLYADLSYDERRDLFLSWGDAKPEPEQKKEEEPQANALEELTSIKGIGAKTANKLINEGVWTENSVWDLLENDPARLKTIVGKTAYRKIEQG